jgi:hypothetical protein
MEQWKKPEVVELHSQSTESGKGKRKAKGKGKRPPCIGTSGLMPR